MEKIGILQGHKTPKKGQQGVHGGLKHYRPSSGDSKNYEFAISFKLKDIQLMFIISIAPNVIWVST